MYGRKGGRGRFGGVTGVQTGALPIFLGKTQPKERDRESRAWTESQGTPITVDG